MTKEEIQNLRELASKATPGPWRYHMGNVTQISDGGKGYPLDYYPDCADVVTTDEADAQIITNDDAEYIAAANPQTVLALLDEIDRYRRAGIEVFHRLLASDDAEQWEMSSILNINNDYPLRKP